MIDAQQVVVVARETPWEAVAAVGALLSGLAGLFWAGRNRGD